MRSKCCLNSKTPRPEYLLHTQQNYFKCFLEANLLLDLYYQNKRLYIFYYKGVNCFSGGKYSKYSLVDIIIEPGWMLLLETSPLIFTKHLMYCLLLKGTHHLHFAAL